MTTTQILLAFSVSILTIVLAVIGVYIALVLKEVRESVKKMAPILDNVLVEQEHLNKVLETAESTTNQISETVTFLREDVIEPITGVLGLVKTIRQFLPKQKKVNEVHTEKED